MLFESVHLSTRRQQQQQDSNKKKTKSQKRIIIAPTPSGGGGGGGGGGTLPQQKQDNRAQSCFAPICPSSTTATAEDLTREIGDLFRFLCTSSYSVVKNNPDGICGAHEIEQQAFYESDLFRHIVRFQSIANVGINLYETRRIWDDERLGYIVKSLGKLRAQASMFQPSLRMQFVKKPKDDDALSALDIYSDNGDIVDLMASVERFAIYAKVSSHANIGVILACRHFLQNFAAKSRLAMTKTMAVTTAENIILSSRSASNENANQRAKREALERARKSAMLNLSNQHRMKMSQMIYKLFVIYLNFSTECNPVRPAIHMASLFSPANATPMPDAFLAMKVKQYSMALNTNYPALQNTLFVTEAFQLPVRYCKKTNPAKDQQKQQEEEEEEGERQGGAKEQQKEEEKNISDKDYAETDDDNLYETASPLSAPFPSPPPQQLSSSSPPPLSPVSLSVSAPVKKVFSLPPVSEIIQPQQSSVPSSSSSSSSCYPDMLPAESIESSAIENDVYMNVPAAVVHPFSATATSSDARQMMMTTFDYPTQHQYATVVTPPPPPPAALPVTPYHTVAQSAPGQGAGAGDGFIYPIQFSDGTTAFHSTFSYQPSHHYHPIVAPPPPQHRNPNPDAQPFQDDDEATAEPDSLYPRHQSQSSTFNYSSEIEESLSTSFQRFF